MKLESHLSPDVTKKSREEKEKKRRVRKLEREFPAYT
jgi:hypothetical protein